MLSPINLDMIDKVLKLNNIIIFSPIASKLLFTESYFIQVNTTGDYSYL